MSVMFFLDIALFFVSQYKGLRNRSWFLLCWAHRTNSLFVQNDVITSSTFLLFR